METDPAMSELTPSMKRRRLDTASSTLSKPFKSPLRAQAKKPDETAQTQSPVVRNTTTEPPKCENDSYKEIIPIRAITTPKASTPILKHKPASSPSLSPRIDPHLQAFQTQHSTLLSQLTSLRQELDTTRQALKIEESGRDKELEVLIEKWEGAGRLAAEELYAGARERVNRMGGVRVWRERVEEGKKRSGFYGEEKGAGEEEGEGRESERDGDGDEEEGGEEKDEDDSFTMDMMLKSLNIELAVLGFDKVNQRWVD